MGKLNEHDSLAEANLHESKGFSTSLKNGSMVKSERSVSLWEQRFILPAALSRVSSFAAPPTEVDGAIYILDAAMPGVLVADITWQSANIVKYTFEGAPDLADWSVGDYYITVGNGFAFNNGRFVILSKSSIGGVQWVTVTNTLISDASFNEVGSAGTARPTKASWDGCDQGEWVRYSVVDLKWNYITPVAGMLVYIIDSGTWFTFTGDATTSAGSQTNITAHAGGGQAAAYQLTKKRNKVTVVATEADSIKAPDAFVDNEFILINAANNALDLFPQTGQNFWNQAVNIAFALQGLTMVRFYCFVKNEWEQI